MSTTANTTEVSVQLDEKKATIQEKKALELKQVEDFLIAVKEAVAYAADDNKYWVNTIRLTSPSGSSPDEDTAQNYIPSFVYVVWDRLELAHLDLPEDFSEKYNEKLLKVNSNHWVIPSCVFVRMLDTEDSKNLSLWLDLPHRSEVDPAGSLSYYRNMQDVARQRETRTKPGRWFGAKELGTETEGLLFNSHWTSTGTPLANYFLLSETKGLSEESWKWSYGNTVQETGSCMIKVPDAARVFAYDGRLDLFYMTSNNESDGKIIARAIIRKDTKKYIRVYYDRHITEVQAKGVLASLGYEEERSLHGIMLGKVKPDNLLDDSELYWLSYIDSNSDAYILDKGDHWLCYDSEYEDSGERQTRRDSDYYDAQYSKGYFGLGKCSCGKRDYDLYIAHTVRDNKEGIISACGVCMPNYVKKETAYSSQYYDKKFFTIVKDYTANEEECDEDCSYLSKVLRKGQENALELPDSKVITKSSDGYLCIDFKTDIETDLFGNSESIKRESMHDFFEYCQSGFRDFLLEEFSACGVELPRHEYKDRFSLKVCGGSDLWSSLYECTSYDWERGRHVKEHSIASTLNILESTGKIKKGAYERYIQYSRKKGEVKPNYKTFRSNTTGTCGIVFSESGDNTNSSMLTGYTFLTAA